MSDAQKNQVVDLLVGDEQVSMASAAWNLVSNCEGVRDAIRDGKEEGVDGYFECVYGGHALEGRLGYLARGQEAFAGPVPVVSNGTAPLRLTGRGVT